MSLADALAIARALAAAPVALLVLGGADPWALALFLAAAATDAVDGHVARRRGATALGAFLDPLADKVLVLAALGALAARGTALPWLVALVAVREVAVTALRVASTASLPAGRAGKVKMAAEVGAVTLLLAGPAAAAAAGDALLALSLLLGVGSAFTYGSRVLRPPRRLARDGGEARAHP